MKIRNSIVVLTSVGVAATLGFSGCSSTPPTDQAASEAVTGVDLSGVCPATVKIQTDWNPEAEHGHLYEMFGKDAVIDSSAKTVSGKLYSGGRYTGVNLEVLSGGPAIGYQSVSAQLYQDKSLYLGYVSTDASILHSEKLPTIAVMAPLDKSPQSIMWDPATYPKVKTVEQLNSALKTSGGVIRYYPGAAYMAYLSGAGVVSPSVLDSGFDGTPAGFVAAKGKDAQQGFASSDGWIYEHEVPAWDKPIAYQLISDAGYPNYQGALSVRADALKGDSPCLKKLVPVLQQADVDYFAQPKTANALIVKAVTQFNNGWIYSAGVAKFSVETMNKLGLASNGSNTTIGDIEPSRVKKILDIVEPIFTKAGSAPKAGLTATDLYTNEFIDTSIGIK
jgi:hypothetical protein